MKKLLLGLMTVVCGCGLLSVSQAGVTVVGANVKMEWTEPTQNQDGSPLTDLKETVGSYLLPGGQETVCGTVPATSPAGGKTVSTTCVISLPSPASLDVTFRAVARDTSGNTSPPVEIKQRIDRLAPKAPTF